jgi:histidinol-phosphatase (PHP family)
MIRPYDLHVHTKYCDGKNTPEEMVCSAIEKGLETIGFSGHMYTPFDTGWCMSREDEKRYIDEVRNLGEKYGDRIRVLCGIERDIFSEGDTSRYDYVIGSVHYVFKDGEYIPVDESPEISRAAVEKYYGGDWLSFCRDYYALVSKVKTKTDCDIVGHFDLIAKFNKLGRFFRESGKAYKEIAIEALENIGGGAVFEINTGVVSRGYRKRPYPAGFILDGIKAMGGGIVLSGDSHSRETIGYDFESSLKLAKRHGFDTVKAFGPAGFEDREI